MLVALILDFLDGFVARLLKISSDIGKQLDSLADVVTFGVLPSLIIYKLLENSDLEPSYLKYAAFVMAAASALRLAKFNIDNRQSDSFIGLPTPANALFILSLPLVLKYSDSMIALELLTNHAFLLLITLLSAYILNAEIPLFSLKIKKLNFADNKLQIFFLLFSVLLIEEAALCGQVATQRVGW
jgi:CDP-diacylglycerol--serine O-phosphatidyltransferase